MEIERHKPDDTAIVLIDYVTGYANLIGSQPLRENVTGAVAMARIALGFGMPLILSTGPKRDPRGPLYPEIVTEIGAEYPVLHRGGTFDAFEFPEFEAAISATGARRLIIAGLMTEGCILNSSLGALQRDYAVSIVVDACAGENIVTHETALSRLTRLGVTPVTWLSLASELQYSYEKTETLPTFLGVQALSERFSMAKLTSVANQTLALSAGAEPHPISGT